MLLGFLALAVLDSINPSAIVVTLYLLSHERVTRRSSCTSPLPLLVLYTAIFVLPPVVLLVGHIVFGRRLDARYADLRERLQAGARETMPWIAGLVGGGLLVSSVVEYIARFG